MDFHEVINFPFTSIKEKDSIMIDNPLDSNRENFRTCIKDSLIQTFYIMKEGKKTQLSYLRLVISIQKNPELSKKRF